MIVVFRNFFRNRCVNLSAKSVWAFLPDVRIVCVSMYKKEPGEYITQEPLDEKIESYFFKTAYVNPQNKPFDDIDSTKTSGYQNIDNGKYFVEGYNNVYSIFRGVNDKVLMLAEDHFFTKSTTLSFLNNTDFDLAYAPWDVNTDANASIVCVNFSKVNCFPMEIPNGPIEKFLQSNMVEKVERKAIIPTRRHADYMGDGKYTNSSEEIKIELQKVGIL